MVRLKTCYLGALLGSLLLSASTSYAAKVVFVVSSGNGDMYQLRWGFTEIGQDPLEMIETVWGSVETPDPENPIKDSAVAFKLGSRVGVKIIWEEGEKPCVWAVTSSLLQSRLTSDIYWAEGACNAPGGHGIHQPDEIHWFPEDMPYFVEWAELIGDVVTCEPVIDPFDSFDGRRSDIFIILDAPKEPMNPAWASLLKYSCTWARYRPDEEGRSHYDAITNTFYDATQRVTFGLFYQRTDLDDNNPNPGGFFYPDNTWTYWLDQYGAFYLKTLLDWWSNDFHVRGNCVDCSVMLSCALCSIGVDFINRVLIGGDPPGRTFTTNPICPIGSNPKIDIDPITGLPTYKSFRWNLHQISIPNSEPETHDSRVWDPTGAQKFDLAGNVYRNPPAHHPPSSHFWTLKDFWQKVNPLGGYLGLINSPLQSINAPYIIDNWRATVTTAHKPYDPNDPNIRRR